MNYKLIILDNIYASIENPIVEKMLYKLFYTKKIGFLSRHDDGFLSIGQEDMVGTQLIIAKEVQGDWHPVCVAKVVTNKICEKYRIEHPMLQIIKGFCSREYYSYVESLIERTHNEGKVTAYSGGFTMNKKLLSGPEEVEILKEMYCAFHLLVQRSRNIDLMMGYGSLKMHTDELFQTWGIKKINCQGDCPIVEPAVFNNVPHYPMLVKNEDYSFYARRMAEKYLHMWNMRMDTAHVQEELIAEAA